MPYMLKVGFYISFALLVILLWQKKKKKPTKLKLEAYRDPKTGLPGIRKVSAEVMDDGDQFVHEGLFSYKGQKYSAYEVLSVPLGADKEDFKKAFAQNSKLDPQNKDLYYQAYLALTK